MSRRSTKKKAGELVLVNTGGRRDQNWLPGVVHDIANRVEEGEAVTELNIVLDGSRMHIRYPTYYIISDTSKNRAKHGLV